MGTSVGGVDKAIRQNSGLAAIGWRTKDEQYMQLFYQDADDNLMTSWFGSMFVNWTVPRKVAMRPGDKAMGGTPLAVSTIWFETNVASTASTPPICRKLGTISEPIFLFYLPPALLLKVLTS